MPSQLVYVRHTHSSHHMNHQGPFFSVHPNSILFHLLLPYGTLVVIFVVFFAACIFGPSPAPGVLAAFNAALPSALASACSVFFGPTNFVLVPFTAALSTGDPALFFETLKIILPFPATLSTGVPVIFFSGFATVSPFLMISLGLVASITSSDFGSGSASVNRFTILSCLPSVFMLEAVASTSNITNAHMATLILPSVVYKIECGRNTKGLLCAFDSSQSQ